MARLQGQVALVTGASIGIGKAVAMALAGEGANIAIAARQVKPLARVADEIRAQGTEVLDYSADVTDPTAVAAMIASVLERFERLDILVNNVGGNVLDRSLSELTVENWQALIDVNLTSAFLCTRAVVPCMRTQGRGTIINIASGAGKRPVLAAGGAYSAAKAGLFNFTESLRLELRQHGIRACLISPGPTDTPVHDTAPYPISAEDRAIWLQPEDVAAAVVFAATLSHRATVEELSIRPTVVWKLAP